MSNTATSHEFYRLEELGRMMALEPNSFTGSDFLEWLEGIAGACKYLTNWFDNMGAILRLQNEELGGRFKDFSEVAYELWVFTQYVIPRIKELFTPPSKYPQEPLIVIFNVKGPEIYSVANSHLASACYYASRALQRQVCWFCQPSLEYNYPRYECNYTSATQVVNDITVVFHRMIEVYDQWTGFAISEKAYYQPDTTDEAITALKRWDKATRIFHELGLYAREDYSVLIGYAHDNRVDLKVGSAAKHLTKIDLTKGEVEYWDRDKPVIYALEYCFKRIGGKLVEYDYDLSRALYTSPTDRLTLTMMAIAESTDLKITSAVGVVPAIVALATSMDYRLTHVVKLFYNLFKHRLAKLREIAEKDEKWDVDKILYELDQVAFLDWEDTVKMAEEIATPRVEPGSASLGPVLYYAMAYDKPAVISLINELSTLSEAYFTAAVKSPSWTMMHHLKQGKEPDVGTFIWAVEWYSDWKEVGGYIWGKINSKESMYAKVLGTLHWYFLMGVKDEYDLFEVD